MPRANDEVAALLEDFAELLELSGERGFRARAYQRAAAAVSGRGADVTTLPERDLAAIPGVGRGIAAKVREYAATGRIRALGELRAQVPEGLRELLRVPGLPGMGERTQENLRRALERLGAGEGGPGAIPLAAALPVGEALREALASVPGVTRVELAGGLRRMKPVVHDLDLLAASPEPERVAGAFTELPGIAEVLARGGTKAVARTRQGYQVDLRVVRPEAWGAALQYLTGSKQHNVRIREIAVQQGLKLSEYGLHTREGELVVAEDEEAVYERLGLAWIPPVLREDRGEVEAARDRALPRLVTLEEVRGDLHCHTDLSPDSRAPLEAMVDAARARGYCFLAIADHAERLAFGGASQEAMLRQRERVRQLARERGDIELLHGAELNIGLDGGLDYGDAFLERFDVLVASVHERLDQPRGELTARLVRACEHPFVNVIGHPTGRVIGRRPASDVDLDALFAAAARTGTALEVNGYPDRLDLGDETLPAGERRRFLAKGRAWR